MAGADDPFAEDAGNFGIVKINIVWPLDVEPVGKLRDNGAEQIQYRQRANTGGNKDVVDVLHHKRSGDAGAGGGQPFSAQSAPSCGLGMSGDKETVRQDRKMLLCVRIRGIDHIKIHHIVVHSKKPLLTALLI